MRAVFLVTGEYLGAKISGFSFYSTSNSTCAIALDGRFQEFFTVSPTKSHPLTLVMRLTSNSSSP